MKLFLFVLTCLIAGVSYGAGNKGGTGNSGAITGSVDSTQSQESNLSAEQNQSQEQTTDLDQSNSQQVSVVEEHPDKIKLKNTPGVFSGAARGNAGFGIAIPGFGFSVNAPVQKEDEKKQALAKQLWEMEAYGAARRVMCSTHRLESVMPEDIDCFQSLGGDSIPVGKSSPFFQ